MSKPTLSQIHRRQARLARHKKRRQNKSSAYRYQRRARSKEVKSLREKALEKMRSMIQIPKRRFGLLAQRSARRSLVK